VELNSARRAIAAIAVGMMLAIAACGGSSGSKTPTPPPSDAPADITPPPTSVGIDLGNDIPPAAGATPTPFFPTTTAGLPPHPACDAPRPHAAGDSNETLASGGIDRTYNLHVPPSYDGKRQTPLELTLHGFGSNARQQAIYSQMPAKGDREGFIVVSPNGAGTPQHWNYPGLDGADDIAFMRDLLDRIEADLCIDQAWVFVTGMSNGAAFSSFVACAMPDRITAIAPVAATAYPNSCTTDRAIPVISFRGTDDACVPYGGGTSQCGQMLPVKPAEDAAAAWAAHDGCNSTPASQPYSAHVRTIAYSECRDDAAVVLFVVDGGGHTWPGSIDVPRLGATTHEVNATDQIWEFFAAQASLRR
jgi:polyhydroxybutyrate depolymerase